jgi:hypothetical protein
VERHVRDKRLQTVTNNGIKLLKDAFRVSSCQVMDPEIRVYHCCRNVPAGLGSDAAGASRSRSSFARVGFLR